jgi:rhamnosyltransferase
VTHQPQKKHIAAIFVTFNPDKDFSRRVKALLAQVSSVIIVDNASTKETKSNIPSKKKVLTIIENGQNLGLAKALNQGVELAKKQEYSWLLLMDQDSMPFPNMVKNLMQAHEKAGEDGLRADLIGTNFIYEESSNIAFKKECKKSSYIKKVGIQTSGSLLSLDAYKKTGPFREDFFIDYVDTEYCLRLKHKGFYAIIACRAHMIHAIGNRPKQFLTANYNATRRYYRTRNGLTLIKEYILKEPWWVAKRIAYIIYELTLVFIVEKNRLQKVKSIGKGIADMLFRKS